MGGFRALEWLAQLTTHSTIARIYIAYIHSEYTNCAATLRVERGGNSILYILTLRVQAEGLYSHLEYVPKVYAHT